MKDFEPKFIDYPEVWGGIAASIVALVILVAVVFFDRHPRFVDVAFSISGFSVMAWLFAAVRMWVLTKNRRRS